MKSIELARALAAAMSLRLPGTVGKIANKMRYIDSKAPLFVRGGIIRSIESRRFDRVYAVGVSSKSRSMPALGGILYGAAALRHDIVVTGNQVTEGFQDSRVDINDMNFLDASERLAWKEYILVYQLLTDLLDSDTKPDVIFVDIPLLVPRAEQSLSLAEPDVEEEWRELIEVMEAFWQRFLPSIYPNDPNGPFLVSLQSRRDLNAAVLNALREPRRRRIDSRCGHRDMRRPWDALGSVERGVVLGSATRLAWIEAVARLPQGFADETHCRRTDARLVGPGSGDETTSLIDERGARVRRRHSG